MRLCAALALVLVALVVVTVKGTQRHPRRGATSIEPVLAEPLPEAAPAPMRSAPSPSPPRYESSGIAQLRGHLLLPAGVERTNELVVVAEGAVRQFRAHVPDDARYEIHLPPGRYTLVASMGELVGVVPDVLARADGPHDVDIRLTVGAVIRGRVKAPPGAKVQVSAARTLVNRGKSEADVEGGLFSIAGLVPGRQYDITFDGADVRRLKVTGVTAPDDGLDVEVVPLAKVGGAIGFPHGGRCPITNAWLRLDGAPDGDTPSKFIGPDCRFSLVVPDNVASVTVVATGDGWNFEQSVAIPATGDPEPICLNPPCLSNPLDGLASLHVSVDMPESSYRSVFVRDVDHPSGSGIYRDCEGRCDIEGLPPGTRYAISGLGSLHHCDEIQMTVVAGNNDVRLLCHRQRHIEGVVRIGEGEPPQDLAVRCGGSQSQQVVGTHFFHIDCNADAASLDYQIGEGESWRSVPIAAVGDPALVQIDL